MNTSKQNNQYSGTFITLEGIEGAGKSVQVKTVQEYCQQKNMEVVITREPGGTSLGENIRELLLSTNNINRICDNSELLLMFAARSQHLDELIIPALRRGAVVVSDRFTDSTYAYQGGGRQMDSAMIHLLEKHFQYDVTPDITFLFDVSTEIGLTRASKRSQADRFETEQIEFFQKAREVFLSRANESDYRYCVINAEKTEDEVAAQIKNYLDKNLQS